MSLFPSKYHRKLLLTKLRTAGIAWLEVSFSGSGDNGSLDMPIAYDHNDQRVNIPNEVIQWTSYRDNYANGTWERQPYQEVLSLTEILRAITSDALDQEGIDWYNNDGGQGHLRINFTVSPPEIELYVGVNITNVEEHNFYFSDDDDEPEQTESAE